jgi:N-methylhydantoinase A
MSVGVDVGGTFTDLVGWEDGRLVVAKTSSTPDQSVGVEVAVVEARFDGPTDLLVHGTTVATNTLLERSGSDVILITDPGFEDLIEIGRQHRPSLYDPDVDRSPPLVPRERRRSSLGDSDPGESIEVVVASIGGHLDPSREQALAAEISRDHPASAVSMAGVDFPEFREYERINTAIVNAHLRRRVAGYLSRLEERLVPDRALRLLVMRSSGGLTTCAEASRMPASILLSGPAGGVVAAAALGRLLGHGQLISFDMGGTSTDVSRIEGSQVELAYGRTIEGQVVRVPSVDVHTVGAGGGSIAWSDPGGALKVGPHSSGAWPGPACYGRGGRLPTVTDADVLLGRVMAGAGLAGGVPIHGGLAREAISTLGAELGMTTEAVAVGVVAVVEATMERAVRAVSLERGSDPTVALLAGFGGAGGLHATAVARRLEMAGVIIPPHAGVFSALGLVLAEPRFDTVRSVVMKETGRLDHQVQQVIDEAATAYRGMLGAAPHRVAGVVEMRYRGQAHETAVAYAPGEGWAVLLHRFHEMHRVRNGFNRPHDPVEVVTVRGSALGQAGARPEEVFVHRPQGEAGRGTVEVLGPSGVVEAGVWWRPGLVEGAEVVGPAVVLDPGSTSWLGPGERAILHPTGALEVTW